MPVRLLSMLGPGFVKFGQIASTRADVLPPAVCHRLAPLRDAVPLPGTRVQERLLLAVIQQESHHLRRVDTTPLGSGSIACVYRAEHVDGRQLAIKIRRPRIGPRLAKNLRIIRAVCWVLARMPGWRGIPVAEMTAVVSAAVSRQQDLAVEAVHLAQLRERVADLDRVTVPRVFPDLSGDDHLAMEYLGNLCSEPLGELPSAEVAQQIMTLMFDMLFVSGLVHCDLHPGNLVATRDGGVAVLDAGFVHQIPDPIRESLARFFLNLAFRNPPGCVDAVLSTVQSCAQADHGLFRRRMEQLVWTYGGRSADEFNFVDFAAGLFAAQRDSGIHASSDFVLPLLALLMVDGPVRALDPTIDFQAIARPVVYRVVAAAEERDRA